MPVLRSYEIKWPVQLNTPAGATRFIDHVGICVLFPVRNVPLPSLYYTMARRTDARWDRHAQLLWKWKDELPKKQRAFYGKYFKGRGTFLSLRLLSNFLAMQGSAVTANGAEAFYQSGRISFEALELWQALASHGPMATLELRHACKMDTQSGNIRFKKGILQLQSILIVTHSGTQQETGAWASNRFDLVSRVFPKQVAEARKVSPDRARKAIAIKYCTVYPSATPQQMARLFGWTNAQAVTAVAV
jgi:hypothetical protein